MIVVMGLVIGISGCITLPESLPPTPTVITAPSATASPTQVWFPPTATFTPFPTQAVTPTAELRTGVGELILRDDFSSSESWELKANPSGRASVVNGELSLAIVEPRAFLFTTREATELADFYLEVTARTSLCIGMDEYGLMLRVTPTLDYYRFSLSCDGQVRLDRIYRGGAAGLVAWTPGGGVPHGAPGQARLGVWAVGEELRFFVDDHFQFSVRDPLIGNGTIGLFARSAGENAVTVSFRELEVWDVSP